MEPGLFFLLVFHNLLNLYLVLVNRKTNKED